MYCKLINFIYINITYIINKLTKNKMYRDCTVSNKNIQKHKKNSYVGNNFYKWFGNKSL